MKVLKQVSYKSANMAYYENRVSIVFKEEIDVFLLYFLYNNI